MSKRIKKTTYIKNISGRIPILQKRISRGVKYLDKKLPRKKWLNNIDEYVLRLENSTVCIAGQALRDVVSCGYTGFAGVNEELDNTEFEYGMSYAHEDREKSWELLTQLWYVRIVQLKIKAGIIK